ncbi:MAG: hypothetical protein RL463_261 [Bacteroidota bacterium]|jgi:hypothetical protein
MNTIKKYLGLLWIVVAVSTYSVLLKTSIVQINAKPTADTIIQWSIFAIIFLPIAIGLVIFGWLAWKGAYEQLPVSSEEVKD